MTTVPLTSRASSTLRDSQKEATRQLILQAALDVMRRAGTEGFSFAAIAKTAGVTERTVYRHFPNGDALFEGLWTVMDARIGVASFASTEADLRKAPLTAFPAFDEIEGLMRAFWTTEAGRALRLRVNDRRKRAIKSAVRDAVTGLPAQEAQAVSAAVQLLYSGAAWMTMKDYWGLDGHAAGKASALAIGLILDGARHRAHQTTSKGKAQ